MNVGILGAGSFGTALAHLLGNKGYDVTVWARSTEVADGLSGGRNPKYLREVELPGCVSGTTGLREAVQGKDMLLSVVPSQATRGVMERVAAELQPGTIVVSASKGIENNTLLTLSGVLKASLGEQHWQYLAYLSGPSFAKEIAARLPTAVTIAAEDEAIARRAQEAFATPYFRTYYTTDVVGLELGGALKNVIAIAAGIVDGLELGHNARASVITRGLAEITRLGSRMGADPKTFAGLAGMGDLVLTCTGGLSRNRRVGLALGQGKSLEEIMDDMQEVAEGVKTAVSVHDLAAREGVECPLSECVYRILFDGLDARSALTELMTRQLKPERA